MILTALNELAEREGLVANPHYEEKAIGYVLIVNAAGRLVDVQSLSESAEGKKATKKYFLVPRPLPGARRSGTRIDPNFLVDNASFVLGMNAPGDETKRYEAEELEARLSGFRALITEAEVATNGDAGLRAVGLFLDDVMQEKQIVPIEDQLNKLKSNDLIAFRFAPDVDTLVHERPVVREYWNRHRASRAIPEGGGKTAFTCLATNRPCQPVDKHPLIKKVPGGTPSGVALVSFNNETLESYALERNENAPISREAAEAYTTALARLLDENYPDPKSRAPMPRRNVRLSDDTVVVFWSRNESPAIDLFEESVRQADPEAVGALYSATWKGRPIKLDDPSEFYALTLSGGQGRATIRGWFESTVRDVMCNVRQHFKDLKILGPGREQQSFPLGQLLQRTAVQGKADNIAPNLAAVVFEAILKGWSYPRMLLDASIRQFRRPEREKKKELYAMLDRAALIKAYLVRAKRLGRLPSDFPEVKPMLDKDCTAQAYRLGRLFAVLEKLQADATNAGTTIRDRFYGAASATPAVVFPQLLRKAPHHYKNSGRPVFYETEVQEIMGALQPPQPFPPTLSLEEQGLFAVGYYHQRQALFTKRPDPNREGSGSAESEDSSTPDQGA
jgi:CRISPR-associated protein Csd1